jgi:quercetin dioxygenase-like cupin family protein
MKPALVLVAVLATSLLPAVATAQIPTSQIVFENPSVRISVFSFVPGGATGRHTGIESEIGIVMEGEVIVDSPTGRQTLSSGGVYWMPGLTPHDVRNEGTRPATLWDIILKRCD